MAMTLARGDTRPLLIGLAITALLGWGLYIYAEIDKADNQHGARREILALTANQEALRTELAQQQQATGTLADLQGRITEATSRYNQSVAARDQAQARLAAMQKELDAARQQQAQLAQQLEKGTRQLSPAPAPGQRARPAP